MRLLAALSVTALTKLLPRWDLYSGLYVPDRMFSREHVIPQSVLTKAKLPKAAVWDIENLYCVDAEINRMRSCYKFVDSSAPLELGESSEIVTDVRGKVHIIKSSDRNVQLMVVDRKSGTFAPPPMSRGAIARTVYRMVEKYPTLYPLLNRVIDEELMNQWLDLPKFHAELQRDEFLRTHGIKI